MSGNVEAVRAFIWILSLYVRSEWHTVAKQSARDMGYVCVHVYEYPLLKS